MALLALIGSALVAAPKAQARSKSFAPRKVAGTRAPGTPATAHVRAGAGRSGPQHPTLRRRYLLLVVATNSGSSWARRSKDRKS